MKPRDLHLINHALTGPSGPGPDLQAALDRLLQGMGLGLGLVSLLDRDANALTLVAHRGLSDASADALSERALDASIFRRVVDAGSPLACNTSSLERSTEQVTLQRDGWRALIAVPLLSGQGPEGVLAVAKEQAYQFSPEEVDWLAVAGGQIGLALESARLRGDLARQRRIQEHQNSVVEEISSELELSNILPRMLRIAEELVDADAGGVSLLDSDTGAVYYPYLHNLPQELTSASFPVGEGVAGKVIATGQPLLVADYQQYPGALPDFARLGLGSAVSVPLTSGEETIGALTLVRLSHERHFGRQDVEMLTIIGRQATLAIQNARLYENLRFYARQITRAQEEERKRIARELHDETIQILIVILRRLESFSALDQNLSADAEQRLVRLQELVVDTIGGVRRFVQDLRPPALDHLGLVAATEGLAGDLMDKQAITTELRVTGEPRRLAPEEELVLFRIAQEAMSNVRRHSGATRASVRIAFLPSYVTLTVEDDGDGFAAPERTEDLVGQGRLGLAGMRERARTFGGALTIRSQPGQGTTIVAEIPVQPQSPESSGIPRGDDSELASGG